MKKKKAFQFKDKWSKKTKNQWMEKKKNDLPTQSGNSIINQILFLPESDPTFHLSTIVFIKRWIMFCCFNTGNSLPHNNHVTALIDCNIECCILIVSWDSTVRFNVFSFCCFCYLLKELLYVYFCKKLLNVFFIVATNLCLL